MAENWPTRPVKLILPYAPGGATDVMARPWAEKLTQAFGHPFVIDNRGGASGAIGTEAAARSTPDGYTFLFTPGATLTVLPQLRKVNYDSRKDFVPVARVGDLVCGFVILPSLGINSIKDLVDYAKKNPGKLAYGSAGLGTYSQMRIEMLKVRAGIDILHVPYRGSADALNDLLAGHVQIMNEINVLPHVRSGKLKLLNINYSTRHPDFPDVPTLAEQGYPGADVSIQYALMAPTGTPKDIIDILNRKVVEIAKTPEMIARMREINVVVPVQTPEEMAVTQEQETVTNGKLIAEAKISIN
ncbi:MAG: Bug family tripartite tricarboxylate transporter substrate binding protein [Acetobacteraceae bacterium]